MFSVMPVVCKAMLTLERAALVVDCVGNVSGWRFIWRQTGISVANSVGGLLRIGRCLLPPTALLPHGPSEHHGTVGTPV